MEENLGGSMADGLGFNKTIRSFIEPFAQKIMEGE